MSDILDVSKCSREIQNTFQIVSSYIVSILYNTLYSNAKKLKISGQASNITDGYKYSMHAFLSTISKPKFSRRVLKGIHSQFQQYGFGNLTYANCIGQVANAFIPIDYSPNMEISEKKSIVISALVNSIKRMIHNISQAHISMIIDDHANTKNTEVLMAEFVQEMMIERNHKYHLFMAEKTSTKSRRKNSALIPKMQKEIERLLTDKLELSKKTRRMAEIIKAQAAELARARQSNSEMRAEIMSRRAEATSRAAHVRVVSSRNPAYRQSLPPDFGKHVRQRPAPAIQRILEASKHSTVDSVADTPIEPALADAPIEPALADAPIESALADAPIESALVESKSPEPALVNSTPIESALVESKSPEQSDSSSEEEMGDALDLSAFMGD